MKRLFVVVLLLLTTMLLFSCGNPEQAPKETDSSTDTADMSDTTVSTDEITTDCLHDFAPASCQVPSTCKMCGVTVGELAEHDFAPATCKVKSTCTVCGETTGEKLEHDFAPATCVELKTCRNCGNKRGGALGHLYEEGKCVRCEAEDPRCIKTPGITRVICVGDSITAGGYWKKISNYLGKDYEILGFGVSGSTGFAAGLDGTGANQKPLAYIDQPAHKESVAYNGDAVVIMLGTNDSKAMNADRIAVDGGEQYKKDIKRLMDAHKEKNPEVQIFIALPPTCFRPETAEGMSNIDIENLIIPLLREVAAEEGAIVIETHDLTKNLDKDIYFPDGCHPSVEGQFVLAKIVADAIHAWKEPDAEPIRLRVALTYDDGPHNEWTTKIVDELNKYDYNATFFVVGNRVDGTAYDGGETMLYAMASGNEIGIHGYTHTVEYETCTDAEYEHEMSATLQAIQEKAPGYEVTLMRPCWGKISAERVQSSDYSIIMWSLETGDSQYKSYENEQALTDAINAIVDRVLTGISDGDIIIMHDLYESTYEATAIVLERLHNIGYDVMTVTELLGDRLQPGKTYR